MISLPFSRPSSGATATLFMIVVGSACVFAPRWAMAQFSGTYGADQGSCDRPALQSILSTSKGNIIGSLGGAALGGLVGNQFGSGSGKGLMTAVGVVGGALAGGYVGRQMDPADHACVNRTLENTPTGQTVAWHDPQKDSSYWVTPTANYQGSNGQPCRNFTTQAVIDGQTQQVAGTACRQPDGSWRTINNAAPDAISPDTVFKVQQKLHDQGFYVRDNIDGRWGPKTSIAVQNYQRAKGLQPSGQLDPATLAALDLGPSGQSAQAMPPVAQSTAPNPPSVPAWAPPQ
jgi:surface antigen